MNKLILFRGKEIEYGHWVCGYPVYDGLEWYIYESCPIPPTWDEPGGDWHFRKHKVDSKTIRQFTGLLDKNGQQIFEGDIIEFKANYTLKPCGWQTGVVQWGNDEWRYIINVDDRFYNSDEIEISNGVKVIGNIFDNPELIKVGEND